MSLLLLSSRLLGHASITLLLLSSRLLGHASMLSSQITLNNQQFSNLQDLYMWPGHKANDAQIISSTSRFSEARQTL